MSKPYGDCERCASNPAWQTITGLEELAPEQLAPLYNSGVASIVTLTEIGALPHSRVLCASCMLGLLAYLGIQAPGTLPIADG